MTPKRICKVCGAARPKRTDNNAILEGWIVAIPSGLSGDAAILAARHWCSAECRDSDPELGGETPEQLIRRIAPEISAMIASVWESETK